MTYTALSGNITSSVGMFTWINSLVNNYFFPGMIIAIFLIILIKMLFNDLNSTAKCFSAASFMTMIICILARLLDFISTGFMTLFIILTAAGAVWMHIENAGN